MFCASATLANGDRPTYPMRSEVPTRRRGLARVWTRGERRGEAYSPKDTMIASLRIWCDDSLLNGCFLLHVFTYPSPKAQHGQRHRAPTRRSYPSRNGGRYFGHQSALVLSVPRLRSRAPDNNRACSTAARLNPSGLFGVTDGTRPVAVWLWPVQLDRNRTPATPPRPQAPGSKIRRCRRAV